MSFKGTKKAHKAKKVLLKNSLNNHTAPKFLKLLNEEELINLNKSINNPEEQNKTKIFEHLQVFEKKRLKCLETHENIINEMKSKTLFATQIVNERLQEYKEHKKTFINCTTRIMNIVENLNFSLDVEKILQEKLCDFTQEY